MRRWLNGEFVLAFLWSALIWAAVAGYLVSYAPTEQVRIACYQAAAKSGHGMEDCKNFWDKATSDPVALFTLVLGVATILLAFIARNQIKDSRAIQRAHVSIL